MGEENRNVTPAPHRESSGRRWLWAGAVGDYATAGLIAVAAALLATTPIVRLLDEMAFDGVVGLKPAKPPRVVLIEQDDNYLKLNGNNAPTLPAAAARLGIVRLCYRADPHLGKDRPTGATDLVIGRAVEREPGTDRWRFRPGSPIPSGATAAALRQPSPHYGIYRSQNYGLAGDSSAVPTFEVACAGHAAERGSYLIPMTAAQNIPRIAASQIVAGVFKGRELAGLTAIVAPPAAAHEPLLATPLTPDTESTPTSLFSAYAVQALLDGDEVQRAAPWLAVLAIALSCLGAATLLRPQRSRRYAALLLLGGIVLIGAGFWAALSFASVLLPVTAMVAGFFLAGIAQILRDQRAQERRLARTLEQAINLSFSRSVFYDQARTPDYLVTLARLLKLARMVVLEKAEGGRWKGIAAYRAVPEDLPLESQEAQRQLALARASTGAIPAGGLAPEWSSAAQLSFLSEGDADLAWVYDFPPTRLAPLSARVAQALTQSLRQMRQWQYRLLGGVAGEGRVSSIDSRVSSAAKLITVQSEQIREGLDALDTAVLVFHPIGFVIRANARMQQLCEQCDITLEQISIGEAIGTLTGISSEQSDTIVQKMLLRGGEMRVPMRDVASRQYVLRVAASQVREDLWQRVIVLEAVDVSELDQLAELRLSVGTFIDRQLRNDLEAITLGTTLALDPRLKPDALARVVGRIKDVAARATGRLEQVAELLGDSVPGPPSPSYPIEARKSVLQALERVEQFAIDLSVVIDSALPAISGFTVAEPLMLTDTIEAILRLVVADTAQGGVVKLDVHESEDTTEIKIAGGFGMPFDRLCEALDARPGEVPVEYQIAAAGFAQVVAWQGTVSYWSAAGSGYRFNLRLRRIG